MKKVIMLLLNMFCVQLYSIEKQPKDWFINGFWYGVSPQGTTELCLLYQKIKNNKIAHDDQGIIGFCSTFKVGEEENAQPDALVALWVPLQNYVGKGQLIFQTEMYKPATLSARTSFAEALEYYESDLQKLRDEYKK